MSETISQRPSPPLRNVSVNLPSSGLSRSAVTANYVSDISVYCVSESAKRKR